jgi:hypothetical protein
LRAFGVACCVQRGADRGVRVGFRVSLALLSLPALGTRLFDLVAQLH